MVFAWVGIVGGLPWNLPALAVALGTVLSNQALIGPWSIQLAIVWACFALTLNGSLAILFVQRFLRKKVGAIRQDDS
jgi:hypothetical protein